MMVLKTNLKQFNRVNGHRFVLDLPGVKFRMTTINMNPAAVESFNLPPQLDETQMRKLLCFYGESTIMPPFLY